MAKGDKNFLADANARLKKDYKTVQEYLTDGGTLKKDSPRYTERLAKLQNARGVTQRTEVVVSGKLIEEARKLYGSAADLYNIPELKPIFENAFINQWSAADLLREIDNTDWAKTRTNLQEAYDVLKTTNPAEAQAKVDGNIPVVRRVLSQKGITVSEEQIKSIAEKGSRDGWNANQWDEYSASEAISMSAPTATPQAGVVPTATASPTTASDLRTIAKDFGIPVTDTTLTQWANDIVTNRKTKEQFNEYARAAAQTLYPSISERLQTATFEQVMSPYKSLYSKVLEVPEENVDITDPSMAPLFSAGDPAKPRMMNSTEWIGYLRKKPEWQNTQGAYREYAEVANTLNKIFGGTR